MDPDTMQVACPLAGPPAQAGSMHGLQHISSTDKEAGIRVIWLTSALLKPSRQETDVPF